MKFGQRLEKTERMSCEQIPVTEKFIGGTCLDINHSSKDAVLRFINKREKIKEMYQGAREIAQR